MRPDRPEDGGEGTVRLTPAANQAASMSAAVDGTVVEIAPTMASTVPMPPGPACAKSVHHTVSRRRRSFGGSSEAPSTGRRETERSFTETTGLPETTDLHLSR